MVSTLYKKMAIGAGWMTLFTMAHRFLGLISTVILARLLIPQDFGIIAMSMSLIAAVELLTGLSLHVVLVQREQLDDVHYNSAFTLNWVLASIAAALVFLLAPSTAAFFDEPRLVPVIYVLAFSVFVKGFENIRIVDFQRDMEFNKDFLVRFIPRLAGFLITVPLAILTKSYWALVAGMVGVSVVQVLVSYIVKPMLPRLTLSAARELLGFSSWLLLTNVLAYAFLRGRDIIVGRTLGSTGLGSYTLGNEIATMPSSQLIMPINRAVYPGYAKLGRNLVDLRKGFADVTAVIALIGFPVSLGVAAVAAPLVGLLLGDKWLHIVELLKLLAINGAIGVGLTNIGPVFNALARPRYMAYLQVISIATLLPLSYWFATRHGLTAIGYATLLSSAISVPISFWFTLRILEMSWGQLLAILWRPALAATVMFVCVTWVLTFDYPNLVFSLAAGVVTGVLVYLTCIFGTWVLAGRPEGAESFVVTKIRDKLLSG
ncbi:MAG: lipopolysaccharide biosynthesis protein [Pseudomonadota bacterium]